MENLGAGLIILFNGIYAAVTFVASPTVLAFVGIGACLAYAARIEVREMDRMGIKPIIEVH